MHAPMAVSVTVRRPTRPREYLTEREIEKMIEAAGENRWGHRDATAILIAYRHGLRSSELVALPRAARPAFTRSEAENYAPCGG